MLYSTQLQSSSTAKTTCQSDWAEWATEGWLWRKHEAIAAWRPNQGRETRRGEEWQASGSENVTAIAEPSQRSRLSDCSVFVLGDGPQGRGSPFAQLWPKLRRWHLKCWFWSTYANCCNFPDEAPFGYLDTAQIVLHFPSCSVFFPFHPSRVSLECHWKPTKIASKLHQIANIVKR